MPLSQNIQNNINNFQCGADGSGKAVSMDSRKVPYNENIRHLIIGLGGTGVDALLEVKGFVQLTCTGASTVRYLGFDTDNEQLSHTSSAETGAVALDRTSEWKHLDPPSIDRFLVLGNRQMVPDTIDTWLDYDIKRDASASGASGVRQLGRLMMVDNISAIQASIVTAVRELMAGYGGGVKLVVSLLSGIGGGTGSGTFLDMACIVRHAVASVVNKFSMYGYLFLPDINLTNAQIGDIWKERIRRNGYAALKELEYFMTLDAHGETLNIDYGTGNIHIDRSPFDYLHIVGATPFSGMVIGEPYQHARQAVARYILSFVANETSAEISGKPSFAIDSFYSNIHVATQDFKGGVPERSYGYLPIGSASYELPVDQIMLYVTHLLFEKMEKMYDVRVTSDNHVGFRSKTLQWEPDQLIERLIPSINQDWYTEKPDWKTHCSPKRSIMLEREAAAEINAIRSGLAMRELTLVEACQRIFNEQVEVLFKKVDRGSDDERFRGAEYGPVYVNHLLVRNAESELALIEWLNGQIGQCQAAVGTLKEQTEEAMRRAQSLLKEDHHKKEVAANFVGAVNEYVKCGRYTHAYNQLVRVYTKLRDYVTERNNAMFDVVTGVLVKLRSVFETNADILTGGKFAVKDGVTTFEWQVITVPMIDGLLREQLDKLVPDANRLVGEFTQSLWEAAQGWSEKKADVSGFISEFLDSHIEEIAHNSIETYVQNLLGPGQSLEESVEKILAPNLIAKSTPLLKLDNKVGMGDGLQMVSIPNSCPRIANAFDNYVKSVGLSHKVVIQLSNIRSRITAISVQSAVPLAAYKDLYDYENYYVNHAHRAGMHLVDNTKNPRKNKPKERINWRELPPPIPSCFRVDTEGAYPTEIRELEEGRRQMFDKAIALPCMKIEHEGGRHVLHCLLSARPMVEMKELSEEATPKEIGDRIKEIQGYLKNGLPGSREVKSIAVTDVTVNGEYDEHKTINTMREVFITHYELCRRMDEEVALYQKMQEQLEKLGGRIADANLANAQRQTFVNLMLCDTIYRAGLNYKLRTGSDEDYALTENVMNIPQYAAFKAFEAMKDNPRTRDKHKALSLGAEKAFNSLLNDLGTALQRVQDVKGAFFKPFQKYIETDYMGQITTRGVTQDVYGFYREALDYLDHLADELDV